MPFTKLIWKCLQPGTSVSENGIGIRLQRDGDERILVFVIDCQEGRSAFGLNHDSQICDAFVFYHLPPANPFLVFVELKGGDTEKAVQQIETTVAAARTAIPQNMTVSGFIAVIISSKGMKQIQMKLHKRLESSGVKVFIKAGVPKNTNVDIGRFLR